MAVPAPIIGPMPPAGYAGTDAFFRGMIDLIRGAEAAPVLDRDPAALYMPLGLTPDPWQRMLLETAAATGTQSLVLCSRQTGKSTVAAALALRTALLSPPALVLIISPAQRQSAEVLRKVRDFLRGLTGDRLLAKYRSFRPRRLKAETGLYADGSALMGEPPCLDVEAVRDSVLSLELSNGSRIICLPSKAVTSVGFSAVDLLILDEAGRLPDEAYNAMRPTRAVSRGAVLALGTPFGRRGWFYQAWDKCDKLVAKGLAEERLPWRRAKVTAPECERISAEFLAEERAEIGERWFCQEYLCQFVDMQGQVFTGESISAVLDSFTPLRFESALEPGQNGGGRCT